MQHLVVENLAMLDGPLQRFLGGNGHDVVSLHQALREAASFDCFTKFSSSAWPCSDRIDSGWNCTPSTASSLWRTPMISPSSVHADTSRQSGSDSRSIASEW